MATAGRQRLSVVRVLLVVRLVRRGRRGRWWLYGRLLFSRKRREGPTDGRRRYRRATAVVLQVVRLLVMVMGVTAASRRGYRRW